MRGRTLLILLATFGAALAFVFWLEPGKHAPADAPPTHAPLVTLDAPGVRRIEIAPAAGPAFAIARDAEGSFRLDDGRGLEADASRVEGLLSALRDARVERALEGAQAADPSRFGLAPAERTVRLVADAGTSVIEVGRASPVGYRRYARVDGGPVLLVDGSIGTAVERDAPDYVERRLLPVEASRVRRIEIDAPGRRLVLERTGTQWRIESPFSDRADLGAAENLARSVTAMTVEGLEPGAAAFGGGVFVRVDAETGGPRREARVDARGRAGRREVERLPGPVRGRILEAAARDLERDPEGWRDTRVTVFSSPDVRGIDWSAGDEALHARRDGGGGPWSREDPQGARRPVDAAAVDALLDAARWLRASGFAPGAPPARPAIARLALSGASGTLDVLEFFDAGDGATVLVRASARPGVGCRLSRANFDELALKAKALAR